eukprot:TRINITY_DN1382_c5_g1_i6.p1 TRINITY_DN1382_c5_g1~~TRINITY_DN1382_c5_g1_i6.p1  ORF type:complete len:306 (+),score=77.30 TRINITY_DN1382_c5_g1_i6:60-920(+)
MKMQSVQAKASQNKKRSSIGSNGSNTSNSAFDINQKKKKCSHNNWDNVRAEKQFITLRCRECQRQHRVGLTGADWKCQSFGTAEGCQDSACTKYHVNYKKQSLEERAKIHGLRVVNYVRLGKVEDDVHKKVCYLKKMLSAPSDAEAVDDDDCESMPSLPASPDVSPLPSPRDCPATSSVGSPLESPIATVPQHPQLCPIQAPSAVQTSMAQPLAVAALATQQPAAQVVPLSPPALQQPHPHQVRVVSQAVWLTQLNVIPTNTAFQQLPYALPYYTVPQGFSPNQQF